MRFWHARSKWRNNEGYGVSGRSLITWSWHIDLVREFNVLVPEWYAGQCPLIDGDRLILGPGGDALMIAVDLATGKLLWKTPNPSQWRMTHSSITPAEFMGRRMYVYCASGGVAGVSAADGRLLWETTDWTVKMANIPAPVSVGDGRIFLSGGFEAGSMLIQLHDAEDHFSVQTLFRLTAETFGASVQTPVFYRDHLLGVRQDGQLVCLDLTGKLVWESGATNRFGNGPFLLAQGMIFVMNDDGLLTLAEASTNAFTKLAQAKVLGGPEAWGPMALADGRLILRDMKQMICLDVALRQRGPRAKGQWEDAGASTPEAALQTLLWAAREKALGRFDEMVFLPPRPNDGWYGSYTNDVPHVIGRIAQCSEVTIDDLRYDGIGVAVIQMAMDGIPAGQVAVSKHIRMIQVGTEWKCDYPHDSLAAFKVRENRSAPSK